MLSIKSPLKSEDIYAAVELAPGHPVYRLDGWGMDNGRVDSIVLKIESGDAKQVQVATKIMSIVDPRATQVALTQMELDQLKMWAQGGDVADLDSLRVAGVIANSLKQPGVWLKMNVRNLMTLDNAVKKRGTGDKADIRLIARALKKHGGLEKLGEIISADLFNGSNDRFAYPNGGINFQGIRTKVIQNVGNVFIACDGNGRGSPIGLDNFDPWSQQRHVSGDQARDMDLSINSWGGHLLLRQNSSPREAFVKDIIDDLEALLGPRNRKNPFGSQNRLGTARKKRVIKGMQSGTQKMRRAFDHYRKSSGGRQFNTGITRKLSTLGW